MQRRIDRPRSGPARTRYASESVRDLLEYNGLTDIDAVFGRGETARCRHRGRTVYATDITDETGRPARVFVKLNWGLRRIWPRMTDLKSGQVFQSLPLREWYGLARLAALGLSVAQPLALFRQGLFSFRAAIVVRAVPAEQSIDEMLRSGRWWRLPPDEREALVDAMMAALLTIHRAGLGWRGTTSRHFFPERERDGRWKLWLIDCEGIHGRATRKARERDYRKLWRAMRESGADPGTLDLVKAKIDRVLVSGAW